jgi:hypothetical protein
MSFITRGALALSLFLVTQGMVAQGGDAASNSPVSPAPRRPLGVYAKVNITDDIAALKSAEQPTTPKALNKYFNGLYAALLESHAISGLEIQVHWDTLNPNTPGTKGDYDWDYLNDAFAQVKQWNDANPGRPPKTIHLIVTPGFQTPKWVLDQIASCNELFDDLHLPPASIDPKFCGRVTFDGFLEETDSNEFPLPWDATYQNLWAQFLTVLKGKYLLNTELVAISVAGPTSASPEMIVPNSGNMPVQTQFYDDPGILANEMWYKLQVNWYDQRAYWNTDLAFIEAWDNAIDLYGSIFPGVTLVVTTGSGLPNFSGGTYAPPPAPYDKDCPNMNMDCAAEATILSHLADSSVAKENPKASQTSGLEASREDDPDLGGNGVRNLTTWTEKFTKPSAQVLGGMEFDTSISSNSYHILKEGCTSTFPPNAKDMPADCHLTAGCNAAAQDCSVKCIPQACLAPNITVAFLERNHYATLAEVPSTDLIPPEQALYNVLQAYFIGTKGSSVFGGTPTGSAPLNYVEVYQDDVLYACEHMGDEAEVIESGGAKRVSAEALLMQASQTLMEIAEPKPAPLTPWTTPDCLAPAPAN